MARGSALTPREAMKSAAFVPLLEKLATFEEKQYSLVALEARQLLINSKMPSYREVENVLKQYIADGSSAKLAEACANLPGLSQPLFDLLISLLDQQGPQGPANPRVGSGSLRASCVPLTSIRWRL